jgi:hypothetical protein
MPYVPHFRATAHFSLGAQGSPKEEATCTLNFTKGSIAWAADSQALADDLFTDWAGWVQDSGSRCSTHVWLDGLKFYSIGPDGKIDQDPVIANGTPAMGQTPTGLHPWQVSVVVSLQAGARGKGRLGRIYLPPQGFSITQDGQIDPTQHSSMFASVQNLMSTLSNKPGVDVGFGIAIAGKTGSGTLRPVETLKMGRVADTQRRRRRSLEESYATTPFTA